MTVIAKRCTRLVISGVITVLGGVILEEDFFHFLQHWGGFINKVKSIYIYEMGKESQLQNKFGATHDLVTLFF